MALDPPFVPDAFEQSDCSLGEVDGTEYRVIEIVAGRDGSGYVNMVCALAAWQQTPQARAVELATLRSQVERLSTMVAETATTIYDRDTTIAEQQREISRLMAIVQRYMESGTILNADAAPAPADEVAPAPAEIVNESGFETPAILLESSGDENAERHAGVLAEAEPEREPTLVPMGDRVTAAAMIVSATDADRLAIGMAGDRPIVVSGADLHEIAQSIRKGDTKTATLKLLPGFHPKFYQSFSNAYNLIKWAVDHSPPRVSSRHAEVGAEQASAPA